MAKKKDVVVAAVIAASFLVVFVLFGIMFIGLMAEGGDLGLGGLGGNVGVVEMYGVINEETGRTVIRQIEDWLESGSIRAIVIHLDTPGGGVAISQEICDAIKRAREEKPVVASMASVAASGGYYIACAADRVIANPGTVTGSIGVIFQYHTFTDLMGKVGIGTETVKSGDLKDVGSYSKPMTKKEELMLRSVVMDSYEQFVAAIAEGRGMDPEEIYPLADGSIFTGAQAYNLGLVDTLGGLKEAVDLAAELAEIEGEPKMVRPYKKKRATIFDLMGSLLKNVNSSMENQLSGPKLLYLYR